MTDTDRMAASDDVRLSAIGDDLVTVTMSRVAAQNLANLVVGIQDKFNYYTAHKLIRELKVVNIKPEHR